MTDGRRSFSAHCQEWIRPTTVSLSSNLSGDRSRCCVRATRMPMAKGKAPGRSLVSLSWYCSHLYQGLRKHGPSLTNGTLTIRKLHACSYASSLCLDFAWQAQQLVLCKGPRGLMYPLASPGVPWAPALCAWILRGRRGTWCPARGLMYALASPGVTWAPALGAWILRGRRGTWCSAKRGLMYALLRRCVLQFAWEARHLVL